MVLLMRIERWDPRRDGPLSEPALRQKLEARGYIPTACTYQPGATVPSRTDNAERIDAVVSGLLKITIDSESAILTPGDAVLIPRGAVRCVEVVGNSPVRCLEAVYRSDPS